MSVKTESVMVATSEYEVNGEKKANWFRVGKIVTKEDGKKFFAFDDVTKNYLRLLYWPKFDGLCGVFEEEQKERAEAPAQDDSLPF